MPDDLESLLLTQTPTAERPLLGLTVLVVEDSLFACEAMRLLCLRSGARIRRADSLKSAYRHLSVYRPVVVIIDLGLPDGSGEELIRDLAYTTPRLPVILGISGNADAADAARAAGADGFLEKPVESLAAFQAAVLQHLPPARQPRRLRALTDDTIAPDPLALRDDLCHVAELLRGEDHDRRAVTYVAQFLRGLARLAHDRPLEEAALELGRRARAGQPTAGLVGRVASLVAERLQQVPAAIGG